MPFRPAISLVSITTLVELQPWGERFVWPVPKTLIQFEFVSKGGCAGSVFSHEHQRCKPGEIIQIIEFSLPDRLLARHPATADSTGAKTNKLAPGMTAFQNRGESIRSKSAAVCGTDRWHRFLKLRLQKRHEHKALGCCKDRRRGRNARKTRPSVVAGSSNAGIFPAPPATGVPLRYSTVRD